MHPLFVVSLTEADTAAAAFRSNSMWGRTVKTSRDMTALKRQMGGEAAQAPAQLSAEEKAVLEKRRAHKVTPP